MANTFELIASSTVATAVQNVTFSSIPSTYTDLQLLVSSRNTGTGIADNVLVTINGTGGTAYAERMLYTDNGTTVASAGSSGISQLNWQYQTGSSATANTFSNFSIYIPNYAGSNNKSISIDNVIENNATSSRMNLNAALWSNTSAITSINLQAGTNFATYSTFYLYGVKNA